MGLGRSKPWEEWELTWEEWSYLEGGLEKVEDKYDQKALHTRMKLAWNSLLSGQETQINKSQK